MARGKSSRGQRDDISPSLAELLAPLQYPQPLVSPLIPSDNWQEIDDRRTFNPERAYRPALSFSGGQAPTNRIPASDKRWSTIGFNDPDFAVICARRKSRREVIFAKRRHRRGRGGSRRRNWYSEVKC